MLSKAIKPTRKQLASVLVSTVSQAFTDFACPIEKKLWNQSRCPQQSFQHHWQIYCRLPSCKAWSNIATRRKYIHAIFICDLTRKLTLTLQQGHKPIERNDEAHEYTVTSLENGFTVLTESQSFPGAVHMGK